ncbi:MAG: branched-chain amino acid ABC transporter permease [Tabrizicola sp.]|uniref:branched-chain amino acid ABC transporter permease n=1 Tax=Tabrizicola sp. TaxID=2005166 RepID=UPI0027364316|nr:branched-chain amino acid ABC transporter permease [Tabrizicola sp.]MDP3264434.1 branched-chain amino acid ABC transporter permease [Tabrizicola sp.]MDP3646480.1 branched-chain amino acid ABC transporter permease [Paracoccaceae bacterium]MDZ4065349.1 branched-chain amino acid ABC transporter permease [Tabrizicola sp.]
MNRNIILFGIVALLYLLTGYFQSWNLSLTILNTALIATIAALGVNMQWGYAGLFSTGVMGFTALGGLAVVLVSAKPNAENWGAGGPAILMGLLIGAASIALAIFTYNRLKPGRNRNLIVAAILIGGFFLFRGIYDPAVIAVEAVNPQFAGNIGGLGLPSLLAWPVGGLLAAIAAWAIGKTALGLRSDYLAIATLGIAEIVIAFIRNEDWLARGVKNLIDLPRPWPVPYEVNMQKDPGFIDFVANYGLDPANASTIFVKLLYAGMFGIVLLIVIWLSERALNSPWGRMMRAIRDNEVAAEAMGKDVTRRHLQVFILGSAVIGFAGAMMTSMDGQLTPGTYNPLRFTFLIWVMVIVGGSGNNWGTVLGGLLIGWLWLVVEFLGPNLMGVLTSGLSEGPLKAHLIDSAQHMRLLTLGVILLLVLRFSPRGLIPEK